MNNDFFKNNSIALIGNPNTGKTSVFNKLTGLNQKVGNYPGITVEKKEGYCTLDRMTKAHLIDLPGTYSVNASSIDESIVLELLMNKNNRDYPDVAVVISDVENLKRNLLLFTQVKDLNIPAILAINMSDRMIRKGIKIDIDLLEKNFDDIKYNGESNNMDSSLFKILSVSFPKNPISEMLLFQLDIMGISCSGGSACSSGSSQGSHVISGINSSNDRPVVRFSFSKYNTKEEIDYVIEKLKGLFI